MKFMNATPLKPYVRGPGKHRCNTAYRQLNSGGGPGPPTVQRCPLVALS